MLPAYREFGMAMQAPHYSAESFDAALAGGRESGGAPRVPGQASPRHRRRSWRYIRVLAMVCLLVLSVTAVAWGQEPYDEDGFQRFGDRGPDPIDQINEALHRWGRVFLGVGVALSVIIFLKIVGPVQLYDNLNERRLRRATRGVDELLKRIQREAETSTEDAKQETAEEGILAGMTEIAEFSSAEQVPAYVLTVNDVMLDNIRATLRRLRRFQDGSAERYRGYLFSVLKGIKTLTEQSAEAGVSSGLAVDVRDYFGDEKRYQTWRKMLRYWSRKGEYQELAGAFLVFMKDLRAGKALATRRPAAVALDDTAVSPAQDAPAIPTAVNEETLAAIQEAGVEEARDFHSLIQTDKPFDRSHAWQFELVRRQEQVHMREEAQRMLSVFLSSERKALQGITRIRMLPCRTWGHVLHMLGVENTDQLDRRIAARLLTIQELLILEKAFLQTFARRRSLERVYGSDPEAGLMIEVHVPEIRRETLSLLRKAHQTGPERLNDATEALNEEETPQNNQVKKLIEHYIHRQHDPARTENRGGAPDASA